RPALDLVRRPVLAREQRGHGGFGGGDLHLRARHAQYVGHAGERAGGAPAADEVVQAAAGEVAQDFRGGGAAVVGGVGGVFELPGEEPAVLRGQFLGLAHHAGAALGGGGEDHLRAVGTHQLAAFYRECLGHHRDELVAARRAHHRQRHAGVAGGGLDHGVAGLEQALFFGVQEDGDR